MSQRDTQQKKPSPPNQPGLPETDPSTEHSHLKERNKGGMLLKIRMAHAVHLLRLKLQTKAEDKTEEDLDCGTRDPR